MIVKSAYTAFFIAAFITLTSFTLKSNRYLQQYIFDIEDKTITIRPEKEETNLIIPSIYQQQTYQKHWNYTNPKFPCILESKTINNINILPDKIVNHYTTTSRRLKGLLYVKLLKTGSSTIAGVNTRIATNYAKRMTKEDNNIKCKSESGHEWHLKYDICKRDKTRSFLYTFLRRPTERAISEFFHLQVSRKGVEPTNNNFMYYVRRYSMDYIHSLSCKGLKRLSLLGNNDRNHTIDMVIDNYDFIGITERLDESLVVLQLLLGLETSDILYISAKTNGNYDDGHNGICHYIQPSFLSEEMKKFFQSDTWHDYNRNNYELYYKANQTLDNTIKSIGQAQFNTAYVKFMQAKQNVNEKCDRRTIKFPCTDDGVRLKDDDTDCYYEDWGCGYNCIDQLYGI